MPARMVHEISTPLTPPRRNARISMISTTRHSFMESGTAGNFFRMSRTVLKLIATWTAAAAIIISPMDGVVADKYKKARQRA